MNVAAAAACVAIFTLCHKKDKKLCVGVTKIDLLKRRKKWNQRETSFLEMAMNQSVFKINKETSLKNAAAAAAKYVHACKVSAFVEIFNGGQKNSFLGLKLLRRERWIEMKKR